MNCPGSRSLIWFAALVFAAIADLRSASRPNVLFIAIDDLRTDLGCYGHPEIISPNIDGLALAGVRFKHAYCQQSVCNPSRASVLTGLRPDATQVHGNHSHYRDAHPHLATLPQHFRRHGYFAGAFGKIYHGVFPEGSSKTFADTFGDPQSWSAPAYRPGPRYYYTREGIEQAKLAYEKMYHPQVGDPEAWTRKLVFGPMTEAPDVADETLYDGMVAQRAISTLRSLADDRERPFFLAVGFIKPHSPFVAPKKYWDLYDPATLELAPDQSPPAGAPRLAMHGSGEIRRYTDQPGRGKFPEENQRRMKHGYAACISYIDAQIGNLLAALEELGLRDDTIVVLWSDHGYHLGEKSLWGKTTNFELDTQVPMIVSAPGKAGNGRASDALVELVDLYPTLIEMAGLPAPDHTLQGLSFVPVLEAPDRAWKRAAFSQFTRGNRRGYSLTDGRYRYTEWIDLESGELVARELYDQKTDPGEMRNLAGDANRRGDVMRMAALLQRGEGWRFSKPIEFRLGLPFGDHMVLQRGKRVPIWGTADPGVEISVAFTGQEKSTVAGADGRWSVSLEPMAASATGEALVVTAADEELEVVDVLVGEVWLCSGQSNMRWTYQQSLDARRGVAAEDNPEVRLLDFVGQLYPGGRRYPLDFLRNIGADNYYSTEGWKPCTAESATTFSAVAYYFGIMLQEQLGVPVGLVHNAIGGIPMESFITTTSPGDWLADTDLPAWCRSRAGENLASWVERPVAPTPHHPFEPGFLYAAGMRPLEGMALSGFVWYQGESNATVGGAGTAAIDPAANKLKFVSLIEGWRDAWGDRSLPFYFVQLPGLNRDWPLFREMQLQVSRELPNTGMVVTIDVGHPTNVHPVDKRPVGERLARLALAKTYNRASSGSSPTLLRSSRSVESMELVFSGPLTTSDLRAPRGFAVAGRDRQFYPATATIDGDRVSLESAAVTSPLAVRYAWENDPDVNLTGANALPVSPFRTDAWPVGTGGTGKGKVTLPLTDPDGLYRTSFENLPAGPLLELQLGRAVWSAGPGHAQITRQFAHRGDQSLHLRGGSNRAATVTFDEPLEVGSELTFRAERWTRRAPYTFRVEARCGGRWQEIYRGDGEIRVGRPFLSAVECSVPAGTSALRFTGSAPGNAGTLIDDVEVRMFDPE